MFLAFIFIKGQFTFYTNIKSNQIASAERKFILLYVVKIDSTLVM